LRTNFAVDITWRISPFAFQTPCPIIVAISSGSLGQTLIAISRNWVLVYRGRCSCQDDYCQKTTTNLAKRFGIIVFEKLSLQKMVKNLRVRLNDNGRRAYMHL